MAQKQSTSPWVWTFLFLMLFSFVAFILFLDKKIVDSGAGSSSEQPQVGSENKPTIDFYSVLPKRKVDIPISDEERAAIENPSINKEVPERRRGRQPEGATGLPRSAGLGQVCRGQ
jgi:hypothetical protein